VTTESWSNLTVNESFANYSEYLWNEHKYGKDFADYTLMKAAEGYFRDPSNVTKDLVRFNYHNKEDMFDGVSYNKGGSILHMLRNYLGDEAFWGGMHDYLKTNEYGTGEAHQFRLSLEKVSGKDLNWFFNQWFFNSGHPKISYTTTFEPVKKQVKVTVSQDQLSGNFQFPLALDIYENGKPSRKNVWVSAKDKNDFTFPVSKNPDFINLNADGVLLGEFTENKTPEQYFAQYSNSKEFLSRYKAVENAAENKGLNPVSLKTLVAALKDSNFRIRMKALSGLDLSKADQAKAALSEVEKMASNDSKTLVQAAAISALAKTKDKKYVPLFEKGMTAVSNSVKASSLSGISAVDPSRVASLADKIDLEGASDDLIAELLPVIVKNKIEKQMPAIASTVAFYPFLKFQNPELGASAEDGFNWIMSSDNLKATENLTKVLTQVKSQIAQNPQAKMMIVQILKDGLAKKMVVLKANPSSPTINQQIDAINKAIEAYK
ncbi:MAG: M1 family metallopeptidase, partial [Kaistella sp.]